MKSEIFLNPLNGACLNTFSIFTFPEKPVMNKRFLFFSLTILSSVVHVNGQSKISEALREHVSILAADSLCGRGFGFPEKILAVEYLTNQFRQAGFTANNENYTEDFLHFEGQSLIEGKNILGIIEGSDPVLKNEYLVLGAHYDHLGWKPANNVKTVYNGADDNASGVASIIEIGRMLAEKRHDIKRSIIIAAFDGEEAGLLGSSAFINGPGGDTLNIKAMFSLDMVGMYGKNKGIDLNGFNSLKNGKELVMKIAGNQNVPVRKTKENIEMRTDTWSFGKKGIPSFYVTTGLISPYHKPGDDSDLLDYEGMEKIVNLMSEIVFEMANADKDEPDARFISHSVNPKVMTGVLLGAGTSLFSYKDLFYKAKPVLAFQAGITSSMRLSRSFFLQSSIYYEMTGSNTKNERIYFHSFSPQLDLILSTPAEDMSKPVFFGFAGGYYSYSFAATGKGKTSDFTEVYSQGDYGINFGVGLRYLKTEIRICLKYGLKNIDLTGNYSGILNRGTTFSYTRYF